jgi:hypothetical protein
MGSIGNAVVTPNAFGVAVQSALSSHQSAGRLTTPGRLDHPSHKAPARLAERGGYKRGVESPDWRKFCLSLRWGSALDGLSDFATDHRTAVGISNKRTSSLHGLSGKISTTFTESQLEYAPYVIHPSEGYGSETTGKAGVADRTADNASYSALSTWRTRLKVQ